MKTEDFTRLVNPGTEYFDIRKFYDGNEQGLTRVHRDGHGTVLKEGAGEEGSWFATYITRAGSCFSIYKEYGPTGIIKRKWVTFRNGGAVVGTRYVFDSNGKPVSAENEEEGFLFTPHQVLQFCENNKIDPFSDNTCIERFIERREQTFYYIIRYRGEYEGKPGIIVMILNGRDGISERVILHAGGRPGKIMYEREKPH